MSTLITLWIGALLGFLLAAILRSSKDAESDSRDSDRWVALLFSGWTVVRPRPDGSQDELVGAAVEQAIDEILDSDKELR